MRLKKRLIQSCVSLVLLCSVATGAWSEILSLSGTANTSMLEPGQSQSVVITWTGSATGGEEGGSPLFFDAGEWFDSTGTLLEVSRTRLSPTDLEIPLTGGNTFEFTLRDPQVLSPELLNRALAVGNTIVFRRVFTQDGDRRTGEVVFQIGAPPATREASALIPVALDVRFDSQRTVEVVPNHAALGAYARFHYRGVGLTTLTWELADPSSTSATPLFRTLDVERRYLQRQAAGALIESPLLPAYSAGWYLLRFSVSTDDGAVYRRVIRYYVVDPVAPKSPEGPLAEVQLVPDKPGQLTWASLAGVASYKLEIHTPIHDLSDNRFLKERVLVGVDDQRLKLLAAVYLPANTTTLNWTDIVISDPAQPNARRWRVLAFDAGGDLIGISKLQPLNLKN